MNEDEYMYLIDVDEKIKNIIINTDFRVSIFGSARIKPNEKNYNLIENLSYRLALEDIALITGGGSGLMEAASKGHKKARKKLNISNDPIVNIGLNIKLPFEEYASLHLDIKKEFERFSERLEYFMQLSNAVIVSIGGIGTLLEFFYSWQLIQVGHINEFPIILYAPDDRWQELLNWITEWLLSYDLINKEDLNCLYIVKEIDEIISILKDFKHTKNVNGNLSKLNFEKENEINLFNSYLDEIKHIRELKLNKN